MDINDDLALLVLRNGAPYFSPAHIMSTGNGPWGIPYVMAPLAVQTCDMTLISAQNGPIQPYGNGQAKPITTSMQYVIGQAPTDGVYTGVPNS